MKGSRQGQGEMILQLLSQAKQTQPGEINLIYYKSNQRRIMRNKNISLNTFSPFLLPSQTQLHLQLLYLLPSSSTRGWGTGVAVSSLRVVSAAPFSPLSSPALAWGPTHMRQRSMNFKK